jgi:hypothetical protein
MADRQDNAFERGEALKRESKRRERDALSSGHLQPDDVQRRNSAFSGLRVVAILE